MRHFDDFSRWHRCRRWEEKGFDCPFKALEEDEVKQDEDVQARPSGAEALEAAVGKELAGAQAGQLGKLIGPVLALMVVLRAVQTVSSGTGLGAVSLAGMGEEATTRVLQPKVPGREGPTPARAPVPAARFRKPVAGPGGAGGGFFSNQTAVMKQLVSGRR